MEKKVAFFDMDGTLIAPYFKTDNGQTVIGFMESEWIEFCNKRKEASYDYCIPMRRMLDVAKEMHDKGYDVKILTVTLSEGEVLAKKYWAKNNSAYCSIFSDVICVPNEDSKIEYIKSYIEDNNITPRNCILVEDSFSTVLKAIPLDINALHISNIYACLHI
ncbi:MAG: hypothetical protein NC548_53240 [Lachnospiraceae bacterium]|nr:hypothetical protein [Lachnospiraceae bacterium]MCM1233255.1 hypothetical protein [Ruminococcus flavefaciens]